MLAHVCLVCEGVHVHASVQIARANAHMCVPTGTYTYVLVCLPVIVIALRQVASQRWARAAAVLGRA